MSGSGGVFVGYECRPCAIRVGTMASVSLGAPASPTCSECGRRMTPVQGRDAPELLTNFHCVACNSYFGAISSVGGPVSQCPNCGAPIP